MVDTPFTQRIQSSSPGKLVQLFEVDLRPIGGTFFRWTPSVSEADQPLQWRGEVYQPAPIIASGFEMSSKGQFPRPRLQVANVLHLAESAVTTYNELLGAIVTRWRVFSVNLDDGDEPDWSAHFPVDVYAIDRRSNHNALFIEWELASILDQEGRMIPKRQILRTCSHTYRIYDPETETFSYQNVTCPYSSAASFDANGDATTPDKDVCSKQFTSGCRKRFGLQAELPFRGFLGVSR